MDEKQKRRFELDNELASYLDKRGKSRERFSGLKQYEGKGKVVLIRQKKWIENLFEWIKPKKKPEEEFKGEDVTEEVKKDESEQEVQEEPDEEPEQEEEPQETRKRGFFERILSFLTSGNDAEEFEKEVEEEGSEEKEESEEKAISKDDFKKVAKFTKDILEKLPKKEIQRLKDEGRVEEFKDILRKYDLIK
ncbi:MAG: hypothetical protein ACQEP1_02785 [Nanobdellota archaeon]